MTKQTKSTVLEMRFDPHTIEHLGLRMYSTLPPALAELISNSYDADASEVVIKLIDSTKDASKEIEIYDNGTGLTFDEINAKFLIIGRNRRKDGDTPSPKYKRLPTGKKGLGKLALFGLAKQIIIHTVKDGFENEFVLDWDTLINTSDTYKPQIITANGTTKERNGTKITLKQLKRVTPFDHESLADSLSKIFVFSDDFNIIIETSAGDKIVLDNLRKYKSIKTEFEWEIKDEPYIPNKSEYMGKIYGKLITSEKPLSPQSGLRGVTLFSRGKLVNAPEFFSNSTSSHFYQYLTGWLMVDFVDELPDDVISTNRQSLDWDNPEMQKFRDFLSGLISQINSDWRKRRKEKKESEIEKHISSTSGIDTANWLGTMPIDVKNVTGRIIETLNEEDTSPEVSVSVIKDIHELIPEYPLLHWRHLHETIREKSKEYYENRNYYTAFLEAMKKYIHELKQKTGKIQLQDGSVVGAAFSPNNNPLILDVSSRYKKTDGTEFSDNTRNNVQRGQHLLSQGIYAAGRDPLSHEEIDELRDSDLFSEMDCLDLLSLLSHLFKRLVNSTKVVSNESN
jgi:uncharacterized protein (TIGR02391 family)